MAATFNYDLIWVDCGGEISPDLLRSLKARGALAINYNHDDPFGTRDGRKWDQYRECLPEYDLVVVVRDENLAEARALGARRVARVFRPYDPVAHAPLVLSEVERNQWASEVIFVGAWMPERGPFMVRLLELGVPLTILGSDWNKDPEHARLRSAIRGGPVHGKDYVKAIQCAKVALGMLSKGNRDLHTTRSAEVPFIGGAVFCAERTAEHAVMFQEGGQALFWSSPEECAQSCKMILADPERRDHLAAAARERVIELHLSNDAVMAWVLNQLKEAHDSIVRTLSVEPTISR